MLSVALWGSKWFVDALYVVVNGCFDTKWELVVAASTGWSSCVCLGPMFVLESAYLTTS